MIAFFKKTKKYKTNSQKLSKQNIPNFIFNRIKMLKENQKDIFEVHRKYGLSTETISVEE